MNITYRILEIRIEALQLQIKEFKSEKRQLKGGRLKRRRRGDKFFYTEFVGGREIGITNDLDRIHMLSRKRMISKELISLEKEVSVLQKVIKDLDVVSAQKMKNDNVYGNYSLSDWEWMNEEYETNPVYPESLQYVTSLGVRVRTKSELAIANALERNGIPYRYEQRLDLPGKTYYPDFTIKKTDGTLLIWEHNGAMHKEGYSEKAAERTSRYESAGYRQHTNLIITYESDVKSQADIDKIIQRFVIF
ncbi:MAG: hypothetical protein IJP00_07325 [Firmicutes bacterium]|nr:hypothetical protein [Bacillota bacterium]